MFYNILTGLVTLLPGINRGIDSKEVLPRDNGNACVGCLGQKEHAMGKLRWDDATSPLTVNARKN